MSEVAHMILRLAVEVNNRVLEWNQCKQVIGTQDLNKI